MSQPIPIDVGDQYKMVRNDLLKILADANDWDSIICAWSALKNLKDVCSDTLRQERPMSTSSFNCSR